MHSDILTVKQMDLIPIVQEYGKLGYYLVGGTALALQLGHRRSIDFDLFTMNHFNNDALIENVQKHYPIDQTYVSQTDQLTIIVHDVQMTWYRYPYKILLDYDWEGVIKMPNVLTIGAMKAFALGQRVKWKDYVDMYFLLKQFSLKEISTKALELFGQGLFDEGLLRGQLSYFEGIDYREPPEYMPGFEVRDEEIKKMLAAIACTE
jgi:hypothetical protein